MIATKEAQGHALMVVATVLVATSFPVGAAIADGMDPVVLTFLRFGLAAVLFAPIVALKFGLNLPGFKDALRYAVLSACLVGFFWAMFEALRHTTALNGAAIFTLTPMITAWFARWVLGDRIANVACWALLAGMIGALWVVFRGDMDALLALRIGYGDLIFFAGTVSMGLYSPLVKRLHRGEPMAQMTFWTLVFGALWLSVVAAPRFADVAWASVDGGVYAGITYLAVFTTIVTFFIMQWSTVRIGPTKAMSYTYLNPSLVFVIGLAMGTEVWTQNFVPGFLLSLLATSIFLGLKAPDLKPQTMRDTPCPSTKA